MKLFIDKPQHSPDIIHRLEKHFKSFFVGDFSFKKDDNTWTTDPLMIFYNPFPNIKLGHNHLFAIRLNGDGLTMTIVDATKTMGCIWNCIIDEETDIGYISRFRHDFRQVSNDSFIDGGQEYVRSGGFPKTKVIKIPFMKLAYARKNNLSTVEVE